jgi:hypothetical protein
MAKPFDFQQSICSDFICIEDLDVWYSGDPKTGPSGIRMARKPNFLKFGFEMVDMTRKPDKFVRFSNGQN